MTRPTQDQHKTKTTQHNTQGKKSQPARLKSQLHTQEAGLRIKVTQGGLKSSPQALEVVPLKALT
jgi:hypothetical protein